MSNAEEEDWEHGGSETKAHCDSEDWEHGIPVLLKKLAGETWKTRRKNREDAQEHSYASKMTEGKKNLDLMGTDDENIKGSKDARGTFINLPWLGGKGVRIM